MHRTKREFVNEVLIRKRPFPKLPALVSPPGGYAGITWTQSLPDGHANKAVEAGVHTSLSIPVLKEHFNVCTPALGGLVVCE